MDDHEFSSLHNSSIYEAGEGGWDDAWLGNYIALYLYRKYVEMEIKDHGELGLWQKQNVEN
jgi:hypothetical protein